MGFKTQHKSSVTGWLFVMFSGGGITAASIKATWWLGHRLISDTNMISGPQEVKCRGGSKFAIILSWPRNCSKSKQRAI